MPIYRVDDPAPPVRVIFSGRVQGVGFRWTTADIARNHAVRGTVRNLSDGTVELCADGSRTAVEAFLEEVVQAMAGNISRAELSALDEPPPGDGFAIVR